MGELRILQIFLWRIMLSIKVELLDSSKTMMDEMAILKSLSNDLGQAGCRRGLATLLYFFHLKGN